MKLTTGEYSGQIHDSQLQLSLSLTIAVRYRCDILSSIIVARFGSNSEGFVPDRRSITLIVEAGPLTNVTYHDSIFGIFIPRRIVTSFLLQIPWVVV